LPLSRKDFFFFFRFRNDFDVTRPFSVTLLLTFFEELGIVLLLKLFFINSLLSVIVGLDSILPVNYVNKYKSFLFLKRMKIYCSLGNRIKLWLIILWLYISFSETSGFGSFRLPLLSGIAKKPRLSHKLK